MLIKKRHQDLLLKKSSDDHDEAKFNFHEVQAEVIKTKQS